MHKRLLDQNALYQKYVILQDLIDDLKYELTGNFERLIVGLMRPPAYHDAKEIKDAMKVCENRDALRMWDFQLNKCAMLGIALKWTIQMHAYIQIDVLCFIILSLIFSENIYIFFNIITKYTISGNQLNRTE